MTKTTNPVTEEPTDVKEKIKCGLIMPISALDNYSVDHWAEVKLIISEALAGTDFVVDLVSNSNEATVIQASIINNIYNSDIVICDVSGKNPNVMFELGMRLAFNKSVVIIKDDITSYSFDTSIIEHINYRADLHYPSILAFKELLKSKVSATYASSLEKSHRSFLDNFGEFTVSKLNRKELSSDDYILESIRSLKTSLLRIENNLYSPDGGIVRAGLSKDSELSILRPLVAVAFEKYKIAYPNIDDRSKTTMQAYMSRYITNIAAIPLDLSIQLVNEFISNLPIITNQPLPSPPRM